MPSITTRAAQYASAAEMRAAHSARRSAIEAAAWHRPAPPAAHRPPEPQPIPVNKVPDAEYASMLMHLLGEPIALQLPRPLYVRSDVCSIVGRHFGLSRAILIGDSRNSDIVRARQAAMYICVRGFGFSHTKVGISLHRDHSTVYHAVNKTEWRMKEDPSYAADIATLMRACGCEP